MKHIKFVRGPAGAFRLGYVAGDEAMFEEKQAKELVNLGFAVYVDNDDAAGSDLPPDIPERKLLLELNVTMEDLRTIDDLTQLKGIGKVTAAKIRKYLEGEK